jgi:hypothetical protein
MSYPKESDLQRFAKVAKEMVWEDARKCHDEGTVTLGAGIAVYAIPKGCRRARQILLTEAPFQGNVGNYKASMGALEWLQNQGIKAYWYDGIMD